MKLWIDDIRPAPDGFVWCKSVNQAKEMIEYRERINYVYVCHTSRGIEDEDEIELIDIDHDAGDYVLDGGDYIKLLDWLDGLVRRNKTKLSYTYTLNESCWSGEYA